MLSIAYIKANAQTITLTKQSEKQTNPMENKYKNNDRKTKPWNL